MTDTSSPSGTPLTWEVVDRYLAGECTPAEASHIRSVLETVPEGEKLFQALRDGVLPKDIDRLNVRVGLEQLRQILAIEDPRLEFARPAKGSRTRLSRRWHRGMSRTRIWIASAMGAAVLAVVLGTVPVLRDLLWPQRRITALRMYTTARGEWTSVTLTDSSSVVLAPETKLQYTIDSRGARRVDLVGEAFFTVAPNTRSPFVVHTGAVTTSVMGTSFDIRHYPDDRSTQVVVTTGRVATGGRFTPVVLAAGSIGHLTDSSVVISPDGNVDGLTSWTQGHLVFHDTQVSAMLSTLGRWSGYEFRLTDRVLAESHVSIGFNANQPEAALQTLKAVLGVTMTFDGNVITLRPEPDGGNAPKGAPIRDVKQHPEPEVGK